MPDLINMLKQYGFATALAVFLLWQQHESGKQRDAERNALVTRIQMIEDYQRNKLEGLVEKSQVVITENAVATRTNSDALNKNSEALSKLAKTIEEKKL